MVGVTSDEQFLEQRRQEDDRIFLINSLDPEIAPRAAPAMRAMRALLAERPTWHTRASLAAAGVRGSDLAVKTVDNMIRKLVAAGFIEQRGEYERRRYAKGVDRRQYRLVEWPEKS